VGGSGITQARQQKGEIVMALPIVEYLYGYPVFDPEDTFFDSLEDGVFQAATTTKLTLQTDYGMKIVFKGDFTIDGTGVVTGGTVESFVSFGGPTKVLKGSGYLISAPDLIDAVGEWQLGNEGPLDALLLQIPTSYIGSSQDDFLFADGLGSEIRGKAGNDDIIGGDTGQTLKGGSGNDLIFAHDGFCFFYGGGGDDVFVFADPTKPSNVKDFNPEQDLIGLDGYGFDAIGPGFLQDSQFRIGTHAQTAEQIIIYDQKTGNLYYDGDGSGVTLAQVNFAKLSNGLDLAAGNFFGELFGHVA
jgi:Ca2+-binding RTX toxin-like protein